MKTIQIIMLVSILFTGAAYAKTITKNNSYNNKKTAQFNNKKSIDSSACAVPAKPALQGAPGVYLDLPGDYHISPVPGATSYVWAVVGGHIVSHNYNNTYVTV